MRKADKGFAGSCQVTRITFFRFTAQRLIRVDIEENGHLGPGGTGR